MRRASGAVALALALAAGLAGAAAAQPAAPAPAAAASAASASRSRWLPVPRATGRLHAAQIGLVINTADPYSVEVGAYYAERRGLAAEQVLRVELPRRPVLDAAEFEALRAQIARRFGPRIQALALAWQAPYAVQCHSITGALALGFDADLCRSPCAAARRSPYFDRATARPSGERGLRPSMLLAAPDVAQARALIDRGVAADGSLHPRARPPANALFITSPDPLRGARAAAYPPPGRLRAPGVVVQVTGAAALPQTPRVLLALAGSPRVDRTARIDFLPGALADDLGSFGGALADAQGRDTALDWIASGATASYGTVGESCSHPQTFPQPQLLLLNYLQGSTAIEAYWKSVAWPQQGLFVGEPLAAPFAPRDRPAAPRRD